MNGFMSFPEQRPYAPSHSGQNMMDMSGAQGDLNAFDALEESLDDIVSQNDKANRRRSMPIYRDQQMQMGSPDTRRLSMMNFGDPVTGSLDDYQFNMPPATTMDDLMRNNSFSRPSNGNQDDHSSANHPAINTQFPNQNPSYQSMPPPGSAYASPMHPNLNLDVDMTSPYPGNMAMPLDMTDPTLNMMGTDMNLFTGGQFGTTMMDSPVAQDLVGPLPPSDQNVANLQPPEQFGNGSIGGGNPAGPSGMPSRSNSQENSNSRSNSRSQSEQHSSNPPSAQMPLQSLQAQEPVALNSQQNMNTEGFNQARFPWTTPAGSSSPPTKTTAKLTKETGGFPSTMNARPHMHTDQFKNVYSSTGFDMLGALMRVATRPKPQIDIGSVDLSCAFVVCDVEMDDNPIVYCSENFERLTGYNKHMILGRNCRFLQSPDGKVEPGVKRKYVDDDSVLYLKNMINTLQEAQISLINYRRGGQPFMNLLTMIPIPWENSDTIKFYVGFQVDLVEQPGSMMNKNSDGSFRVNYQRNLTMPSYIFDPARRSHPEIGQTISKDEVSNVLTTYGSTGDSEITRRLWDKVLLENTDDVVHVLSLKGLFLYLSPSSNHILEYDPSELVGTALSSVCHPSDIVPVTRELKETSNGASVNVVFRIRRKKSGYMWFEGHGSLHTEQGKGRKCIILVGRERPVYTLSKEIVRSSGGIGENELWTKMSTSGMFLFVSSNVRQLLDRQPDELVGTSIQALMRQDSKANFGRILELSRTGRKGEVKHEMINKRGQVLQAFTTLYPGDAIEGQKPTFLVGQTRLLKYSRSGNGQRPSIYTKQERASGDSHASLHSVQSVQSGTSPTHAATIPGNTGGSNTPATNRSDGNFKTTEASVTTFPGVNGLALGHQDHSLASDDNVFDELKTTRSTSWQYELRQMEKRNRYLAEEVQSLLASKKKRKRRKGAGQLQKDCANCHTRTTPEWRRGPSGNRDLCNSCGLRWAKQNGRVSPRASSQHSQQSDKSRKSSSPRHNQHILPNNNVGDPSGQPSMSSTTAPGTGLQSPQQTNNVSHAAKVARMEGAASQGYGGGIPPKIDEGVEPD
ncbi:white collar-1 transcript variant 2 [Clohesyomyces aquaticus]|uniref:White collar-1 transcript variant 2 n=1 Tax=Clohesyomyces aquaticus TaxID=1231657 RepID=A0A1Y1ZPV9_9PLEO|nr:white collar-1 transcript variant 2 [Clohesyomyces aquaticus]